MQQRAVTQAVPGKRPAITMPNGQRQEFPGVGERVMVTEDDGRRTVGAGTVVNVHNGGMHDRGPLAEPATRYEPQLLYTIRLDDGRRIGASSRDVSALREVPGTVMRAIAAPQSRVVEASPPADIRATVVRETPSPRMRKEDANIRGAITRAVNKAGADRQERENAVKATLYRAWARLTKEQTTGFGSVVGFVPLVGVFSLRPDGIYTSGRPGGGIATTSKATSRQVDDIERAMTHGAFQIEWRPYSGIASRQGVDRLYEPPQVLYQARGLPLAEAAPVTTRARPRARKAG